MIKKLEDLVKFIKNLFKDLFLSIVDEKIVNEDPVLKAARGVIDNTNTKKWNNIIIHHSLTKDGKTVDFLAIKNWHKGLIGSKYPNNVDYNKYINKPMKDVGYHFGIEEVDGKLIYQRGRPLSMEGAHTLTKNDDSIGICEVGNYDKEIPSTSRYHYTAVLCKELMKINNILLQNVQGHRDYAEKSCPGKNFDINILVEMIRKL